MKRRLTIILSGFVFIILTGFCAKGFSQTNGTMTFSVTCTAHSGSYGSSHVVAIWLEHSNGTFLKTKLRRANTNHTINNHLPVWKANSNKNVTDAVTGATLTNYTTPLSVTWNATDTTGTIITDGIVRVLVEESWDEGAAGHDTVSCTFTKGTSAVHLTPSNTANFTSMVLDWNPTFTAVQNINQDPNIIVYPTVTRGPINIDFEVNNTGSIIQVVNSSGRKVYEEKVGQDSFSQITVDLSDYANGVYFINILNNKKNKIYKYKVILSK